MQPNFIQPWNNGNFMCQYMQQHAAMTNFIDRMHYGINYGNGNSGNSCNEMNYDSCCASCCCCNCSCRRRRCSCCSSGSCPEASPSKRHQVAACSKAAASSSKTDDYYSEKYEEEQFQDKEMDEDEMSDCEYEFNVDAILAMRAAKKELLEQEKLESKKNKSSKSKNKESSESKSENESRSDSSTSTESEKEEIEYIDITKAEMVDKRPCRVPVLGGGFHRTEEEQARNYILEQIFGREGKEKIMSLELLMLIKFEDLYDEEQPSFWPVLPLRM